MRVGCRELWAHSKLEMTATCRPGGTMHGSALRGAARLYLSTSFPSHSLRKLLRIDLPNMKHKPLCGALSVGHLGMDADSWRCISVQLAGAHAPNPACWCALRVGSSGQSAPCCH